MILYPTETVYALGVNVLNTEDLERLFALKERTDEKVSWLVRDLSDIEKYAVMSEVAAKIAERFLPGPLTLVLQIRTEVKEKYAFLNETIGFRISTDPVAQKIVKEFMEKYDAPLTCTSANVSGMSPEATPEAICAQFGERAKMIDTIIDDGPRMGTPSTVIGVVDDTVTIFREGAIPKDAIFSV